MNTYPVLTFTCPADQLIRLATVLQSGFYVTAAEGDSLISLLKALPGFSEAYIAKEIQTVFLNGDALDDLQTPLSGSDATIALAGAMPGLAGAIVRKGSPWGALRKTKTITTAEHSGGPVSVLIKLFNTVAVDRGPGLLTGSVRINAGDLIHFLELRPSLLASLTGLALNGSPVAPERLSEAISGFNQINVKAGQP
ncbi:MAG: hypothetical protein LJE64_11180 [Desulfofustis sp.]|jgi:hypothetical protein|nr:hypothetical protein [Desulfofustis sp.]